MRSNKNSSIQQKCAELQKNFVNEIANEKINRANCMKIDKTEMKTVEGVCIIARSPINHLPYVLAQAIARRKQNTIVIRLLNRKNRGVRQQTLDRLCEWLVKKNHEFRIFDRQSIRRTRNGAWDKKHFRRTTVLWLLLDINRQRTGSRENIKENSLQDIDKRANRITDIYQIAHIVHTTSAFLRKQFPKIFAICHPTYANLFILKRNVVFLFFCSFFFGFLFLPFNMLVALLPASATDNNDKHICTWRFGVYVAADACVRIRIPFGMTATIRNVRSKLSNILNYYSKANNDSKLPHIQVA